jgi:2-polyprenyl-3-methyl-5-hydroxy-6-metoxy-1,4-benzoquinol methylase
MKILTFNWHESYIHLLSKTGHDFDVVEKWKGGRYGWIKEFRPVPSNCRLISEEEANSCLNAGAYDRIIAHNINDLLLVYQWQTPKVLVFHNKLSTEIALGGNNVNRESYLEKVRQLFAATKNLTHVFISKAKMDDWGFDGEIILPGIDPLDYDGYKGDTAKVLRIGNLLKGRDIMLGFSVQERILHDIPSSILGLNPGMSDSYIPESWEKFKGYLRDHRVYLNTTLEPYEDGYNLSSLEAMATGMPIVSISNSSSPIKDGNNGFISNNEDYLRSRIEELLSDRAEAVSIGKRGRERVLDLFPIQNFLKNWNNILTDSQGKSVSPKTITIKANKSAVTPKRILMSYTSNPVTTAAYMERALRRHHDVITYGPSISNEVLKSWDMEKIKGRVNAHDIPYITSNLKDVSRHLPSEWKPELFLWIESGISYHIEGMADLSCPSACYLIDTHLNLDRHIGIARDFDYVFLAQRAYIPRFKEAGIQRVFWLPLACDPEIHKGVEGEKRYDIGFVGSITQNNQRRKLLLDTLSKNFNLHTERCFLEDMASVFGKSRIVFNSAINDDLNMRVFEALSSGSMLLTDEASGSGLTDFFNDREHLVIYNDQNLVELARYYLEHPEERERIACTGRKEALSKHTYDQRVIEMLSQIEFEDRQARSYKDKTMDTHPKTVVLQPSAAIKEGDYFRQERRDIEAIIPEDAMRILDVGCGEGMLGKRLLQKGAREVVGIELDGAASKRAQENISRVICGNIEDLNISFNERYFDCMVFADILEHLIDPLSVLKKFKGCLADSGVIVASIPNVRYYGVLSMLVEGHWRYENSGILDKTHLRFFTLKEIGSLFKEAGFEITGITANIDPRYQSLKDIFSEKISFGRLSLEGLSPEEIKDLFVFQYLIRAKKTGYELQMMNTTVNSAFESNNLEEAKKAAEDFLDLHPANTDALYRYAEICFKLGEIDKAIDSLERLLIFEPDRDDALDLREKILGGVNADKHL